MAKEELIREVLKAANELNLIKPGLKSYALKDSLNTANEIIGHIENAKENGLDLEQLTQRTGLNLNTIKVYIRELEALKKIRSIYDKTNPGNKKTVYFEGKHEKKIR